MNDIGLLKKAERKLEEHLGVCKRCDERTYDPTISECTIAHQLQYNVTKIRKRIILGDTKK